MLISTDVTAADFAITKFREGYEQTEVDELLDRARAALAAWESRETATLTAADVNAVAFHTTKFGNGYDQDQVDDFLDQIATSLSAHETAVPEEPEVLEVPASLLRSSSLLDTTFTHTRFREGYSVAGVDGFLAAARAVIAAYESDTAPTGAAELSGDDVVNVRFTPTKFKRGYSQAEVDEYLDRIVVTLRHYERAAGKR